MRSETDILGEYMDKDAYYNRLSEAEKLLDRLVTRDSLEFRRYLFKTRVKEFIEIVIQYFK